MKTMDPKKKERLEAAGWRVGDAADFLGLSPEEELVVELRLKLRQSIRDLRKEQGLTQEELAKRLGSTQPRISAMESASSTATLDMLIRAQLALDPSARSLAETVGALANGGVAEVRAD